MYYTAELQNAALIRKPDPTSAGSLTAAKRVASQRQTFKGTTLMIYDSAGYRVAVKDGHRWRDDGGEPLNCAPDFEPDHI